MTTAAPKTAARHATEQALLDAAERLLADAGYARITTRRLADRGRRQHGFVHYYFGSNENLLVRALERFTERIIARQRQMYAAHMPFLEKWRNAISNFIRDDAGYQKIWLELQALAWNNPEIRERLARVNAEWRAVLTGAIDRRAASWASSRHPADGLAGETFNLGIMVDRLVGIDNGPRVTGLNRVIDNLMTGPGASSPGHATRTAPATSSATACGCIRGLRRG